MLWRGCCHPLGLRDLGYNFSATCDASVGGPQRALEHQRAVGACTTSLFCGRRVHLIAACVKALLDDRAYVLPGVGGLIDDVPSSHAGID